MYYDKRIRYLSYYESDIKLQNAGYVKFQVRDSLCQMIIYVKGPRLMGSGEAAVYLLSRKAGQLNEDGFYMGRKDSRLQKHLLGNLSIHNGQGHCAVRMNAENMADCGLRYDEICGIRIELHEYQYLESQWSVVNFMPGTRRMPDRENTGYKLRTSQSGAAEETPVKVDLIVTPVSENLKVEKLTREETEEEPVYEEIRREITFSEETTAQTPERQTERISEEELEEILSEDEDSMQGMLAREVRREEARSAGSVQPEQSAQEEPAEPWTQSGQVQRAKQPEQTLEEEILRGMERAQREEFPQEPGEAQLGESPQESERVQKEENMREAESVQREENMREAGYVQGKENPQEAERGHGEENPRIAGYTQSAENPQGGRAAQEAESGLQGMESARDTTEAASEEEIQPSEEELQADKWEQLRKNFPVVHPIREEEEYLKISPKDFVIFTEKYQELVHNSFLLHGYYNYKHLILGKKEKEGRVVYYLGVPGTFHEREKTVAVMFGFEAFDGRREPAENGDFGYYLRRVEI